MRTIGKSILFGILLYIVMKVSALISTWIGNTDPLLTVLMMIYPTFILLLGRKFFTAPQERQIARQARLAILWAFISLWPITFFPPLLELARPDLAKQWEFMTTFGWAVLFAAGIVGYSLIRSLWRFEHIRKPC